MHSLAVIGNPIEHSLSPVIWQNFAHGLGVEIEYSKILANKDNFVATVNHFFDAGGSAMSVTAPFKAMAYQFSSKQNQHTKICQTGNLLIRDGEDIIIDNTDGAGLIEDIKRLNHTLHNKKVLFIGNGSVIHSVLSAIEAEEPKSIHLLMRDYANLAQFKLRNDSIEQFSADTEYDIVINTTPNHAENKLFEQVKHLSANALAYDMIYTASQTLFMQSMQELNSIITTANGIGMLIQQAKVAFIKVFGQAPDVEPMYNYFNEYFK